MTSNHRRSLPLLFIALSAAAALLYAYLLSKAEPSLPFLDPFSIAINVFWLVVLAWVAWYVYRGAAGAKVVLLVLGCVVSLLSCIDLFGEDASLLLFAVRAGEALLFFAAYLSTPFVAPQSIDTAGISAGWSFWRVAKYVIVTLGILAGVFAGFVGLAAAGAYWWMNSGIFAVDDFDGEAWSRPIAEAEGSCHRGGMASDIRKRVLKPGMSKADVERLLGPPDGVSNPREYQYGLGMCSGFQMHDDNLHIYFNEQGAFERAAISSTAGVK